MVKKIIGVLGLGVFGQMVAKELGRFGSEVIAVDTSEQKVQDIADAVTYSAVGDFTDIELLKNIGINNCDVVIIATGSNLESAVLAVMHCKKLHVPKIIAKAHSKTFEEVLYEVGVDAVISPERDSGYRLASKLLRNRIDEVLRLDENTSVIEFDIPDSWVGKSLQELDLRQKYEINLIGIRPEKGEPMTGVPISDPLPDEIVLVGIANSHTFEHEDYLGNIH
ncbi:potassium channel family protein [Eremococcus coleocola]|uniref:potassium channel family protein n=1 Tax=Eremococcus coleocola TaxID=88132 RepID=UPI000417AE96|nr:TrkA family potassium uptake protein [Eremococcus coleocola]